MKKIMNMTLSQKRKLIAATTFPLLAMVLLTSFQNCSPGVVQSAKVDSLEASSSTNIDEDTKPVTVAYSENLLISMQQQTGLTSGIDTAMDGRLITANNNAKAKLSETGKADTVNAPMMIAITNLSGAVCLELVNTEKAKPDTDRRFFSKVDFSKAPTALTIDAKEDIVRRMARNFWSRNETVAEKTVLLADIDEVAADPKRDGVSDGVDTEDVMIYTCSAMLASLDAIRF